MCTPASVDALTAVGRFDALMRPAAALMLCTVSSEPMTDTPRALPTWRMVVFAPLATPELAAGISDSTTFVSCAPAKPIPAP